MNLMVLSSGPRPDFWHMSLGALRGVVDDGSRADVVNFLSEVPSGTPDEAVVVLEPGRVSFLRDEEGRLLGFR